MTTQFLIESGKHTCENDMNDLLLLLNVLEKPFKFRFHRIAKNQKVIIKRKEEEE